MQRIEHAHGRAEAGHEIWEMDGVAALGRIMVRKDLVVDEVDAKRVRDDDDDALGRSRRWCLGGVGIETMKDLCAAFGRARMHVALEAIRT